MAFVEQRTLNQNSFGENPNVRKGTGMMAVKTKHQNDQAAHSFTT